MNTGTLKIGILALILSLGLQVMAGLPGNWEFRDSHFSGILNGVASAPGQLIAVGSGTAILRSDDVINWTRVPFNPGNGDFYCVTFGNGLYVAGGTFGCLMAISSDGINWSRIQSTGGIDANFGVTFARRRFVAVGRGTSPVPNCRLITSTNGIDWENAVRPTTNTLRAITFGNGKYVAVGDHGTIITSPDGIDWTVQNSGTEHLLRSVIFTGRDFIAGGDSSSLLTSGDGISWVSVPFSSFDVRGLATCGTAVVAVGALNPGGRAQSSTDGLFWTNDVSSFPAGLNAIVQYELGRFIAVGANGLIVDSTSWADIPVNTWTKTTDGLWQEAYWSLGHVPSWKDASIVFTNAGSNTLEIDATTTRDYPDSLKLNTLIIDAPEGSRNRLLLNSAGHDIPLQINTVTRIPAGATLEVINSSFETETLHVNGHAVFRDNAEALFTRDMQISVWDVGEVIQSNAVVSAGSVSVGTYLPGTWLQSAGTLHAGALSIGANSAYTLTNGRLTVDGDMAAGTPLQWGPAEVNIAGGTAAVNGRLALYDGTITLTYGTLTASNTTVAHVVSDFPARFVQIGGEHRVQNALDVEGIYDFRGGRLTFRSMKLRGELNADRNGGISNGDIDFDGGILRANTARYFDRISVISNGTIDFQSTAAFIRFETTGTWSGILVITNWIPAVSRFQIGWSGIGVSIEQLSHIRFVNPGGFSPGIYSARITSSGEVVPVPRLISYQRGGNNLVLTWPEGYRLFSATNVAGPYSLLTNAISPYTASYTDPQRFFITANEN